MSEACTIVPVAAADIDPVMAVMAEAFDPVFGEAWTAGQCLGMLTLPGVWMVLAQVAGAPAGFALARVVVDEAELLLLGVRPAVRRRGVGAALLLDVLAQARTRGAANLHLEMRDANPAIHLYRHHGFSQTGRRPGYYRGGDGQVHDALSLSRPLPATDRTG